MLYLSDHASELYLANILGSTTYGFYGGLGVDFDSYLHKTHLLIYLNALATANYLFHGVIFFHFLFFFWKKQWEDTPSSIPDGTRYDTSPHRIGP
jgi:hypothetical protein